MLHRPSLRSTVTTLAAAAVLVGGADLASYAATGNAFILGHSNSAGTTTSLKNTGRGPALSLNSIKSAPPLVVNSSKMVKHLNANMVGGKTASQLAGTVLRFPIGAQGQSFAGGTNQLFYAKLPATGNYQVGITGLLTETGGSTGDDVTCLVIDKAALDAALAGGGGNLDFSKVYGLTETASGDSTSGILNYTNHAQKIANKNIALGCIFSSAAGTYTNVRQIAITFKPESVATKHVGSAVPLPKSAGRALVGRLR
jgi:hypothetical protein